MALAMNIRRSRAPAPRAGVALAGLAALLGLAALAGCGGDTMSMPGCEAIDHTPCNVLVSACQARLWALAACLRGDQAGELPPVSVVSETDFAVSLMADVAATTPDRSVTSAALS